MKGAVRLLVVGAAALAFVGCASTSPDVDPTLPPRAASLRDPLDTVPWSGEDLRFLERAVTAVGEPRQSPAGDDSPIPEVAVGETASLTELVVAVSFEQWNTGRSALVDAGIMDSRAAAQVERGLVRLRGASVAGYLDVDSRRLPAALGLHWSGWERLGLGLWRDPASQVSVQIPRRGGWRVRRGADINAPVEETVTSGTAGRLAVAGVSSGEPVPMIIWVQGLTVAELPEQVLPSQLTVAVTPGRGEGDLLMHVALPFATERDARVAMVVARLVIPRFLQEIGLDRGERFDILRNESELYLVNIALTLEQLTEVLRGRAKR